MYDPVAVDFHHLDGNGLVLGVEEEASYSDYTMKGWPAEAVIFIGTDGITETHNSEGQLFGAARVREIVRTNAHLSADEIQVAVIRAVQEFRGTGPQEDDLTLVVLKLA
jgi:sigma-B regulation protein RsbU (phosphoserine phosphatase)